MTKRSTESGQSKSSPPRAIRGRSMTPRSAYRSKRSPHRVRRRRKRRLWIVTILIAAGIGWFFSQMPEPAPVPVKVPLSEILLQAESSGTSKSAQTAEESASKQEMKTAALKSGSTPPTPQAEPTTKPETSATPEQKQPEQKQPEQKQPEQKQPEQKQPEQKQTTITPRKQPPSETVSAPAKTEEMTTDITPLLTSPPPAKPAPKRVVSLAEPEKVTIPIQTIKPRKGEKKAPASVESDAPPPKCTVALGDGTRFPLMKTISAGRYDIAKTGNVHDLKPFLNPMKLNRVRVESPFLIQKREVTIAMFRRYVHAVLAMKNSPKKSARQDRIGLHWNKDNAEDHQAVTGISHEAAMDYVSWLNSETSCRFRLPSKTEWAAAVLAAHTGSETPLDDTVAGFRNLLRGVREWSRTSCGTGFLLLGEDNWVTIPANGGSVCMPSMISVAGFRVVRLPD
ncbi:MAG: SUMF1/EgtB/PvdO family nonheme iron enzyme [Magnetococcales bacterium]|nr:SUMF1/EgtB/PvdO family nonheme iron enzyme [Magnetococcales bacterium]